MCSPIQFLKAFVASPLLILGLAIICCGCKGGFGRNINPYAAYGSPRIPPPGTGAIGTNQGSGSAGGGTPVGTGVSSNQPQASLDNPATNTNSARTTNSATPPYYSNNASLRDSGNGTTTGSVPATPVSGGDQWRPVDRSNSLPQSRVPNQGTSTQGGSSTTQNYTTQNDNASGASSREGFVSQIAPASYNEPAMADNASGSQPTSVNHLLNGMRVNDATRQSPPAQFTPPAQFSPPADARPLSTATGSESHTQSGWNASGNNALSQQGQPTTNVASQLTQEEFAAFVQGVPPQVSQPNATTQAVAIATTLPNAASFDPNASIQAAAPGTSNNSAGTSSGWRTRDE